MIRCESFMEEHIRNLQKSNKGDPVLLERVVYAFGLLEALTRVGMPFRFKGGTYLILLMDQPRRLFNGPKEKVKFQEYAKIIVSKYTYVSDKDSTIQTFLGNC